VVGGVMQRSVVMIRRYVNVFNKGDFLEHFGVQ
jgi:hypothetical protein